MCFLHYFVINGFALSDFSDAQEFFGVPKTSENAVCTPVESLKSSPIVRKVRPW